MHFLTLLEKVRLRMVQHAIRKMPLSCLYSRATFMRDGTFR